MTTTDSASLPGGIGLTPLDPAFQQDPYAALARLRKAAPVHYDEFFHRWVVTRHDDVDEFLRDRSLSVDGRKAAPDSFHQLFRSRQGDREREPSILFLDAPDHTRLRGLVNKAFTPRAVEQMAPRIQAIADELLDAVQARESFDLIGDFSGPLPTIVIAEMLGVDPADRADFKRWSDNGVMGFDPFLSDEERQRLMESGAELEAYFTRAIAERRAGPRNDLISAMVAVEDAGDQLTDGEILSMCGLLLAAGNVTTTDLIGNGVLALLRNPEEMRKLRDDPSLVKNAVEEMLRYDSPVLNTGRIPLAEASIGGCPIGAGSSVSPSLAAANHDPAVYPHPDRFDITRSDVHHQSFGGGAHFCLGAPLARLEAQLGIGTLVRRFPNLRLADEPLQYRRIPGFRGLAKLTVLT